MKKSKVAHRNPNTVVERVCNDIKEEAKQKLMPETNKLCSKKLPIKNNKLENCIV